MAGTHGEGPGSGGPTPLGSGGKGERRGAMRGVRTTLAMAHEKLVRGDARAAEALCREAHGAHGTNAELLALLGRALTEQGRHGDAAPFLAQAISLDRRNARAHRDLGESLLQGGRAEVALVILQRARRLSRDPLPGLDALIDRARDATEREGLSVIADPDDAAGERTLIVRVASPGASGVPSARADLDDPEADETQLLDAPPGLSSSLDQGPVPELTDPAGLTLAGAETRPGEDDETVLAPGPPPGPARSRPPPALRPPPVLDARASYPVVEAFDDDDDPTGTLLAGLAAAMPDASRDGRDRLDIGVDDVLNAVLGGRFLVGDPSSESARSPGEHGRFLRFMVAALATGAVLGLGLRLLSTAGEEPGPGPLAADTRLAFTRFLEATAHLDANDEPQLRLRRAYALAATVADHGGRAADAREALDLLAALEPEATPSTLGLATLAHLRVAAPDLPAPLRASIAAAPPGPEPLRDALTLQPQAPDPDEASLVLAHRSLARLALLADDPLGAARELRLALERAPGDPATHRELLRLAGQARAPREVQRALDALLQIDPDDLEARSDALLWKITRGQEAEPDEIEALRAVLAALRDPPSIGRVELVLAVLALQAGDIQGARRHLGAASGDDRSRTLARILEALSAGGPAVPRPERSVIDLALGRLIPTPGRALPFRLKSDALGPIPAPGSGPPTDALKNLARRAHAMVLRQKILASSTPGDDDARSPQAPMPAASAQAGPEERLLFAHALLATGDVDAALLALPREADLPGGASGAAAIADRLLRGLTLHAAGQGAAAEASLGALGRAGYRSPLALQTLGRLQLTRGDAQQALASLDGALALTPTSGTLAALRVIALHRVGRPDEATRAMSLLRQQKPPPGLELGTDALLETLPGVSQTEQATVDLYRAQSDPELPATEVERLLRRALASDPKLTDAHFHLGRLLARLDRKRAARRSIARYLRARPEGLYAATARALLDTLR